MPTALDDQATRQRLEKEAADAISECRVGMILGRDPKLVFFSFLAMKLDAQPRWDIPTMCTDGRHLLYNPEFTVGLSKAERRGVFVHEIMHCASMHFARMTGLDHERWNIAADLAINHLLLADGFTLPDGCCVPGRGLFADLPEGESAEFYYAKLPADPGGGGGSGGKGQGADGRGTGQGEAGRGDPGGSGGVMPAGDQAQQKQMENKWQIAVGQATEMAKARGNLSEGLAQYAARVIHRPAPWTALLQQFLVSQAKDDYAWTPPNRRFIASGLYLPSNTSESLGRGVLGIDVSGSIACSAQMLGRFAHEVDAITNSYYVQLAVLYHDVEVTGREEWSPEDGPLVFNPVGGGGTSHVPLFDAIREMTETPSFIICMTDGYTEWPEDPGIPTLWLMTTDEQPPFGQVVRMREN